MVVKNQKRNWVLLLGFWILYTWPLFSQESSSHTVKIRIVRPIVFNVKPVISVLSSQREKEKIQMEWEAGKRPKKITASIVLGSLPVVLEDREMRERWTLSPNYDREILYLQSPKIENAEWVYKIKAVPSGSKETPNIILYTMAEM